ncbi:MAG: flavodoxin family protein [Lachnospiraceae bacterium]|nr:flavodoxin family protein [Lachnospiraceae bacterium]
MSKKVLILSGSPRKGGNSDLLCDEFMRGAVESGNQVEKIFIRSKKIAPCNACYYCRDNGGKCAIQDDMSEILDKMQAADVIVMASPVYFYSIDAQMKTVIDRSLARWTSIPNKEFYYIMTAAEKSATVMDCTLECFRGFATCLNGSQEIGVIYGKGVYQPGEILEMPAMQEAYKMGTNV